MTVRENLLPSAMVPGLVTVEDKEGNRQNVYPIDAKELIASGDYTLVENGAIEAARMAATPLRSGMAAGIPGENIVVEVSGIEGRIIAADTPEEAERIKATTAGEDGTGADPKAAQSAAMRDSANAQRSANQPKTDAEKSQARADSDKPSQARTEAERAQARADNAKN